MDLYLFEVLKAARIARERITDLFDAAAELPPDVKEKLREAFAAADSICNHLEAEYEPINSDFGVGLIPREVPSGKT